MRLMMCFLALVAFQVQAADKKASEPVAFTNDAWFQPAEPLHIAGSIYYVGTRDLASYLITTSAGHILLDGAMPGSERLIEDSIRKLGFKTSDIRLLLISHAHMDHVGTLAYFKKLTNAPLVVMPPDDELLKSGGTKDYLYAKVEPFHFPPVTADRTLRDGETITLGDVRMTAHHTPGHTRGCTTWTTTVKEGGRDYRVVFAGSTSVNPGTHLVKSPSYPGIADDYTRSFKVLESLKPEIFLSAHASFFDLDAKRGKVASEGVRAFVDPEGYRRANEAKRAVFEKQLSEERSAR
jgi:metallo-beta-lactamase class B